MDRGRAGCRVGDIGEARGDETRGRFVLIARDMADLLVRRMVEASTGVQRSASTGVYGGRKNLGVFAG